MRMSYNKFIYNWVKAIRDNDEISEQYLKSEPKYKNLYISKYGDLVVNSVDEKNWCIADIYEHEDFECDDWKPNCFTSREPSIYLTSKYFLKHGGYSDKEINIILSCQEIVEGAVQDLYGEFVKNNSWEPFISDMT
tara:strand:- start:285 stop:692 length:408 start_codon:yes stop_codon:yes gene_type:complete